MKTAVTQGDNSTALEMEVPFRFGELFFSRTDERGRILSGNGVFQRISQYSWDELIDKPHNIIRHPDMPRAVFWLLWDTLKRGNPIGAYVKNRAKDGRYYWVFAIVTPAEGGYLSVRLKPSSPVFQLVEQEYRALAEAEAAGQLKPAASGKILLDRIVELGFRDYTAFMSAALAQEISARDRQLDRAPSRAIMQFEALGSAAQNLLKQAEIISDNYATSRYIPLNLRVQAAQLGQAAATIGVISVNYSIISTEIKTLMDELVVSARRVAEAVAMGYLCFAPRGFRGKPCSCSKKKHHLEIIDFKLKWFILSSNTNRIRKARSMGSVPSPHRPRIFMKPALKCKSWPAAWRSLGSWRT